MRKHTFALTLALFFATLYSSAQLYDSTGYYNQMNHIFAPLDKTQIASGLLRDYSIEFSNWDNFTGAQLHDSNSVIQRAYGKYAKNSVIGAVDDICILHNLVASYCSAPL